MPVLALALALPGRKAPQGSAALPERGSSGTEASQPDLSIVRGVTISCQTWGREWGFDGFADELSDLKSLGANWVAIHPYARIGADGSVAGLGQDALDPDAPPEWLAVPLRQARRHGMGLLIKPHLAYWGSPFSWRGAIEFADPDANERFWREYSDWIVALARVTSEADAFSVGTELDRLLADEDRWRALITRVRAVSAAQLTYAANWDAFERVGFWDALDAVGVQAYFPLAPGAPGADFELDSKALRRSWREVLTSLRRVSERSGKPVVFTELGYHPSPFPASRPWDDATAKGEDWEVARRLQLELLRVSLDVLAEEASWLRGAFLWKWFVGETRRATFELDTPPVREVIRDAWG